MKRHVLPLVFLIIASFWTVKPLLPRGYFTMHDDTQVARVVVMGRSLRNGQFPVRWVSDLGYGYGYPLFNFYGPLPYYIGGGLYAAGIDPIAATKIMMGVGMMLAAVTMYGLAQLLFGTLAGIVAATLYAYAPYHAVQLYVRGAVGELWAYAFLPLLFLGLFMGTTSMRRKDAAWIGGLGLAGIILSHTIMGYVTAVFYGIGFVLYAFLLIFKRHSHFSLLTFHFPLLFIGLGLSAFFWLPAIAEMRYTNVADQIGATANFRDHFVCLSQLWNSLWGYGGSAPGCIDGMSFKIGKIHVLLGVLGLALGGRRLALVSMVGVISLFMLLSQSRWFWELMPGFAFVQYPWRMLTGVVFAASVLGGAVIRRITDRWLRVSIGALILSLVIAINAKLFVPQTAYDKPAAAFETVEELSWRVSRVSDEYLPEDFVKPESAQGVARDILASDALSGLVVETEINTETYAKLHVQTPRETDVVLKRTYFPGWTYWVNGARTEARVTSALPVLRLPQGNNVVEMRFGNTIVRFIGSILSIVVLVWFLKAYGKNPIA